MEITHVPLIKFFLEASVVIATFFTVGIAASEEPPPCPQCIADFAIYNPSYEDDGVWEEEVTALEHMFKVFNWTYRSVDQIEINTGILASGPQRKFRALIAPGGWSWYREEAVTENGEKNLRAFVENGGHFVGFCAGAYWAAKRLVFAMNASGKNNTYSTPEDFNGVYPYELALYPGDAKGPLGWMPWKNGTNVNFSAAIINLENKNMRRIGLPKESRFLYGGGPFFPNAEKVPGMEVWARAKSNITAQTAATGEGQATIVHFPSGKGSVTLFSYHPDVLIKHQADGIALKQFFDEDAIKWDLGSQTYEQINLDSWNIVHAALQIAADQEVTALKKLP